MEIKELSKNMEEDAEKEEFLDASNLGKRKFWYNRTFILFAMMEWMRDREVSFLCRFSRKNNIRNLNIGAVEILMKYLGIQTNTERDNNESAKDPFRFFLDKKNYRVYSSLGKIKWEDFPIKVLSYSIGERKKQQIEIKDYYEKYTYDYTGGIDFDGDQTYKVIDGKEIKENLDISQEESVNRALEDLKVVRDLFNKYKIKYFVQFSGSRGFHLFYEIPLDIDYRQKIGLCNRIKKALWETLDLKTIDRYPDTLRKVFKCPYTLETNKGVTRVILPLDDSQIDNFDISKTDVNWVYRNISGIKTRGLLWRNNNIIKLQDTINYNKMLEDFEIEIPKLEECKKYD